jgi:hypothetical protein
MISTDWSPVARIVRPAGLSRGASHFARTVTASDDGSPIGHDTFAVAGLRMWSNRISSRAGPVTPRSTGAASAICPGFEGMSACQPIHAIVYHKTPFVARGLVDVGNDCIARVGRVDRNGGASGDLQIGPDAAKAAAFERRTARLHLEADDLRVGRQRKQDRRAKCGDA